MRKFTIYIIGILFILISCGPKPQYKTREGKKKNKYYNSIQYKQHHKKAKPVKF